MKGQKILGLNCLHCIHMSSLLKSTKQILSASQTQFDLQECEFLYVKLRFPQAMCFTESLGWDSEMLLIVFPVPWLQNLEHAHFPAHFHPFSFLFIQFGNPLRQKLILAMQTHLAKDAFLKGTSRCSFHTSIHIQYNLLNTYSQYRLLAFTSSVRSKFHSCCFRFVWGFGLFWFFNFNHKNTP